MKVIDRDMRRRSIREERLLRFREFAQEQFAQGRSVRGWMCLQSEGTRDFYGSVTFSSRMERHLRVLPAEGNPNVLLFDDRHEAKAYAKTLQQALRECGYPYSKTMVEEVAVQHTVPNPYSQLVRPEISYEPKPMSVILIQVR